MIGMDGNFSGMFVTLPLMVQWKMGVSPILVAFHSSGNFPLNHDSGNVAHENGWLKY